jgi:hypothetical protein
METQVWSGILRESYQAIASGFVHLLPKLLVAFVVFVVGWIFASLVERLFAQIIRATKVDSVLENVHLREVLHKAGFKLDSGRFVGALVKWFIVIVFLVASLQILGLGEVTDFLKIVAVEFLPKAITAVLIVLVAAVIAEAVQCAIIGGAKATGVRTANLLGSVAKWSIWIFAIMTALKQLGVEIAIIQTLFQGIVIALALSVGLSFGLGGQEAAARYIEKVRGEIKKD